MSFTTKDIMFKQVISGCLLAATLALFAGCSAADQDENRIPWSRPASWEGTAPGMGDVPGRTRY